MMIYLFKMMTSWAIVVDVWYLPPMIRYCQLILIYFMIIFMKIAAKTNILIEDKISLLLLATAIKNAFY